MSTSFLLGGVGFFFSAYVVLLSQLFSDNLIPLGVSEDSFNHMCKALSKQKTPSDWQPLPLVY